MQSSFQNLINMQAQELFLHQQDSFDDKELVKELKKHQLHVYMICKTPSMRIDIEQTTISNKVVKFVFYTTIRGKRNDIIIEVPNDQDIKELKSEYPYFIVKGFDSKGEEVFHAKTGLLIKILAAGKGMYIDEFDLEVLYVGQAFGKNGSRITVDRLRSHDKAQKIYFETQQKFPDYEIWFVGLTFRPLLMTMFKPWGNVDRSMFNQELNKQKKLQDTPISFDQRITLMEAALIKHFNTYEYNKEYLDFPSPEHSSYDQVYQLDFNSAGFELSTQSLFAKLWSKSVKPSFLHYESYFLHNNKERRDMLKWFEDYKK